MIIAITAPPSTTVGMVAAREDTAMAIRAAATVATVPAATALMIIEPLVSKMSTEAG